MQGAAEAWKADRVAAVSSPPPSPVQLFLRLTDQSGDFRTCHRKSLLLCCLSDWFLQDCLLWGSPSANHTQGTVNDEK